MTDSRRKLLVGSALLLMGIGLLIWLFRVPVGPPEVSRLIRTNLPMGATKAQVLRRLESWGWPYESWPADAGAKKDPSEVQYGADSVVFARIEGPGSRYFDLGHITATFAFDRKGRLIRYKVEEFGPDPL